MLSRIFEPFVQIDREQSQGLGIGLTLARSLLALHGGRIEAHSRGRDRGSEFVVLLPSLGGARGAPSAPARAERPAGGRTILVVDDNRDAAEVLGLFLEASGSTVHLAFDGPSALEAVRASSPEIVLLDIGMPGMDGHEVARRIRQMPQGRTATLVALSGWGQPEDIRRSMEAGMDLHLVKPAAPEALSAVLASHHRRAAGGA